MIRPVLIAAVTMAVAATGARATDTRGLEQRANAFYDRLARGDTAGARSAFAPLEQDLARTLTTLRDGMDAQREALIERDGDLEALYQSAAWRADEVASLVLGYHLAWVRYQGAQLTDDATRKKKLLREAAEGFGEYTAVREVPEIYAESLYGRGLALMDLGQYRDAIADLEIAAGLPRTAGKAKGALAEARRRAAGGKPVTAPTPDEQLGRLRTLLTAAATTPDKGGEALEFARGLSAQGGEWPAKVRLAIRDTLGGGKDGPPASSFALALLGQLAVDARRCDDLPPLVAAGAEIRDAGRTRWRPDLLFLNAACTLNAGKHAEAARLFATIGAEFPTGPRVEEAAYYRCRALDVARHGDPSLAPDYEPALRDFLARFGKSPRATEIRFLLAESSREHGDCAEASKLYAQITAGEYVTRARLAALECRVAALGPDADAERAAALSELRAFIASAPKQTAERTLAKASLLGALLAVRLGPPDDAAAIAFLDGYERRYPKEPEWHDTAQRVRLDARLRTGQYAEASADLDRLLAQAKTDPAARKVVARIGRDLTRRPSGDPEQSRALARKIWTALAADGANPQDAVTLAELELDAGNAAAARPLFEAALAAEPTSTQARRGLARAAAALGDRDTAMAAWRRVVEQSTPGGTSWYEARLAQFDLLVAAGHTADACDLARRATGQSKTTGGDVLAKRLAERATATCR